MSANPRLLKRYSASLVVGTSESDFSGIVVPSGKIWQILRFWFTKVSVTGVPTYDLKWTDSSNVQTIRIQNAAAGSPVDTQAINIPSLRGTIWNAGDKLRAIRTGGTALTLRATLYVMEE